MLDDLVILLSTDWFSPHWQLIGISADEQSKVFVQERFRSVVEQILGGAGEYWLASFSDSRLEQTQKLVDDVVSQLEPRNISFADAVEEWSSMSPERLKWLDILYGLTIDAIQENSHNRRRDCLDLAIRVAVGQQIRVQPGFEVDLEPYRKESRSRWDKFVFGITPDIPSYSTDTVMSFIRARSFRFFLASIRTSLPAEQFAELCQYYTAASEARGISGLLRYLELPS